MVLRACRGCSRHVDERAEACPFCGVSLVPSMSSRVGFARMSRASAFVAGAALAGCYTSSDPAQGTTPQNRQGSVMLTGKVINSTTGQPLDGVLVTIDEGEFGQTPPLQSTSTSADGSFSIAVPAGHHRLTVHAGRNFHGRWPQRQIVVEADKPLHVDFPVSVPSAEVAPLPMPYGAPPARTRRV